MESTERGGPHTIIFRYRTERSRLFGTIKRPVAKVYVRDVSGNWVPCFMYIDSGADFTIIPYRFGLMLGLRLEGPVEEVYGIGGGIPIIIKRLELKIGDVIINARVGWSLREDVPFLLGRMDVFNEFNIEFREREEKIIFKYPPSEQE